jgi:hypothetical protein
MTPDPHVPSTVTSAILLSHAEPSGVRTRNRLSWRLPILTVGLLVVVVRWSFRSPGTDAGAFQRPLRDEQRQTAESICIIQDPEISEASGIAVSRTHPGFVWIHNDSGDRARLFLVGKDGRTRAVVTVTGEQPRDWEDMCSFMLDDQNWLLIGDIGDNAEVRGASEAPCRLLLIREPAVSLPAGEEAAAFPVEMQVQPSAEIRMSFTGGPVNCESLSVETQSRTIYLVSKTDASRCRLYQLPLQVTPARQQHTAEVTAAPGIPFATAMDVSPDG